MTPTLLPGYLGDMTRLAAYLRANAPAAVRTPVFAGLAYRSAFTPTPARELSPMPDSKLLPWAGSAPPLAKMRPAAFSGRIGTVHAPESGEVIMSFAADGALVTVFRGESGTTITFAGLHAALAPLRPRSVQRGETIGIAGFNRSDGWPVYVGMTFTVAGVRLTLPAPAVMSHVPFGTGSDEERKYADAESLLKNRVLSEPDWVLSELGAEHLSKLLPPERVSGWKRFLRTAMRVVRIVVRVASAIASVAAPGLSLIPSSLSALMPSIGDLPAFARLDAPRADLRVPKVLPALGLEPSAVFPALVEHAGAVAEALRSFEVAGLPSLQGAPQPLASVVEDLSQVRSAPIRGELPEGGLVLQPRSFVQRCRLWSPALEDPDIESTTDT